MSNRYEELRLQNIADNKRILAELGLANPYRPKQRVVKKAPKRKREASPDRKSKKFIVSSLSPQEAQNLGSTFDGTRRSSRIKGQPALTDEQLDDSILRELEENDQTPRKSMEKRPNEYGAITGVEIGTQWATRIECSSAGIHRPTVAGIHSGPEGAYSIALSGGYEDDIDLGEGFTYTGEGGRDLKGTKSNPKNLRTAAQSKDQTLSRGNAALVASVETKNPVRVIRGYKSPSAFAPDEGYRYDGLYMVEKHWFTTGLSGYGVYKFVLRRCTDQAPPPWDIQETKTSGNKSEETNNNESAPGERIKKTAARRVKEPQGDIAMDTDDSPDGISNRTDHETLGGESGDMTLSKVKKDVTSSEGKEDMTSSEVKADVTSSEGKEYMTSLVLKADVTSSEVTADVMSSVVEADVTSSEGKEYMTSLEVKADVTSSEVKKDVTSSEVKADASSEVKKDVTSSEGKEDMTSSEVKADVTSSELKADVTSSEVKADVTSSEVMADVTSLEVKADASSEAKKDVTSSEGKGDMTSSEVKEDMTSSEVKADASPEVKEGMTSSE